MTTRPSSVADLHVGDMVIRNNERNPTYQVIRTDWQAGWLTVQYLGDPENPWHQQWTNADVRAAFGQLEWRLMLPAGMGYPEGV